MDWRLDDSFLDWMLEFFLKGIKTFEITGGGIATTKNVMVLKIFLTEKRIVKDLVFKNLKMTTMEIDTVSNLLESIEGDQLKTLSFEQ
jgi:hypothetical protein